MLEYVYSKLEPKSEAVEESDGSQMLEMLCQDQVQYILTNQVYMLYNFYFINLKTMHESHILSALTYVLDSKTNVTSHHIGAFTLCEAFAALYKKH